MVKDRDVCTPVVWLQFCAFPP